MKFTSAKLSLLWLSLEACSAFEVPTTSSSRRAVLERIGTAAAVWTATSTGIAPEPALASGGATAGKYTTIPIAKRRYYGRVQEGVHEFVSVAENLLVCFFVL